MDQSIETISSGELIHRLGTRVNYVVTHGWDVKSSLECDRQWKQATVELLNHVAEQNYSDERLTEVLDSLSMEDAHWNWFDKARAFIGDEYEWFHLHAEGKPQGACVIYHPKESALSGYNIFYVEFIAAAPWNRENLVRERELKGVGRTLLAAALRFSIEHLNLSPGFCLHSLPKAQDFYLRLQMVKVESRDKGTLAYFELPAVSAEKLMEVL